MSEWIHSACPSLFIVEATHLRQEVRVRLSNHENQVQAGRYCPGRINTCVVIRKLIDKGRVLHEICESHRWSFDTLMCLCVCLFVRQTGRERERESEILITQSKLIEEYDNNLMLICADKNVITLLVISGRRKKKKLVYQLCFRVCGCFTLSPPRFSP